LKKTKGVGRGEGWNFKEGKNDRLCSKMGEPKLSTIKFYLYRKKRGRGVRGKMKADRSGEGGST